MRQYGASMPPWADVAAIDALYDLAARLSAETGIPHEVDHIIPRRHPLVCGLHIPANLQVITKEENFAKSNRWEDM
jgi:5-methylcytosine-specific restriction endonuclease McrA